MTFPYYLRRMECSHNCNDAIQIQMLSYVSLEFAKEFDQFDRCVASRKVCDNELWTTNS